MNYQNVKGDNHIVNIATECTVTNIVHMWLMKTTHILLATNTHPAALQPINDKDTDIGDDSFLQRTDDEQALSEFFLYEDKRS